jgi:hypothetical protein
MSTDPLGGEHQVDYQDGTLITEDGTGLTFVIMDGKLCSIENGDLFDMNNVTTVDTGTLEQLRQEGGPAVSSDAYLAIVDGKGYLVNNGQRRYFTSEDAIRKYNFNRGKFQDKSTSDIPDSEGANLG